jgi:hypothetical protein
MVDVMKSDFALAVATISRPAGPTEAGRLVAGEEPEQLGLFG